MNPEDRKSQEKMSWRDVAKEIVIFAMLAFGVVLPFRIYVAEPYIVDGASMNPTFATSDYLIVNKISYYFKNPQRNTVVVFRYPNDPSKHFIKRVIGLPGDTIVMKDNAVTIINTQNPKGVNLNQSYIHYPCIDNLCVKTETLTLSQGQYFVMGDNREESFDSRSWGPVSRANILGQPILRLFPLKEIGLLPGSDNNK